MTIKQLVKKCHNIAVKKGFWGDYLACKCSYCKPKNRNISEILMLIVSELAEAQEALRNNNDENFREELADTAIRLADLCGGLDIDLEKEIIKKIKKNIKRPYKHNKEF